MLPLHDDIIFLLKVETILEKPTLQNCNLHALQVNGCSFSLLLDNGFLHNSGSRCQHSNSICYIVHNINEIFVSRNWLNNLILMHTLLWWKQEVRKG